MMPWRAADSIMQWSAAQLPEGMNLLRGVREIQPRTLPTIEDLEKEFGDKALREIAKDWAS